MFKTGNGQKTTPSNASSSIYSLLNKLQNVNNTDTKFSLDVDRFSNDLRIHTMYAKTKETTTTQQMQKPLPQRPRRVSVMFPSIAVYPNTPIMSRNFHLTLADSQTIKKCSIMAIRRL